jgi:hypothetical protein
LARIAPFRLVHPLGPPLFPFSPLCRAGCAPLARRGGWDEGRLQTPTVEPVAAPHPDPLPAITRKGYCPRDLQPPVTLI